MHFLHTKLIDLILNIKVPDLICKLFFYITIKALTSPFLSSEFLVALSDNREEDELISYTLITYCIAINPNTPGKTILSIVDDCNKEMDYYIITKCFKGRSLKQVLLERKNLNPLIRLKLARI